MRIAIPVFRTRISPLLDTAERFLMVDLNGDNEAGREVQNLSADHISARVSHLARQGVEVLICGGISRLVAELVESSGIRLIPWIAGETEEVLNAFKSGNLPARRFLMPGCGRGNRFGRRCRGGWEVSSRYKAAK